MELALAALERNIAAEMAVQQRIQALLDLQLSILMKGRSREFGGVLAQAEEGLAESARLEAERMRLLEQVGVALGVPAREVTLARIEQHVGESAAPLVAKGVELKERIARIRESNRQVALLLRHSVLFIEDLLGLVSTGRAGARTYGRDGDFAPRANGALAAEA